MRTNVLTGETPFRRAYIRSVIDQVEVDDTEIRIIGRRSVLERLVMGGGAAPAGVPSFVRKWRATSVCAIGAQSRRYCEFTATEEVANGSGHPDGRIATGAQQLSLIRRPMRLIA